MEEGTLGFSVGDVILSPQEVSNNPNILNEIILGLMFFI